MQKKEFLNRELEKRSPDVNQERVQQTIGKFLSSYDIVNIACFRKSTIRFVQTTF